MYDFILIMDLLKLIVRLRSLTLSKISYADTNISHQFLSSEHTALSAIKNFPDLEGERI